MTALEQYAAVIEELRAARIAGDDSEATDDALNGRLSVLWGELTADERIAARALSARAWPED